MKKISAVSAVALFAVCTAAAAADDPVALTKEFKGDCLACHSVDKKMVGPAWRDVANRYRGQKDAVTKLTNKVIKGGKGNWDKMTGGMAMPPHPTVPSGDQITKIVRAILELK